MKKTFVVLMLVVALTILAATPVSAGGGKVRGESGQGGVNQVQIQDPPPFQP